MSWLAVWPLAAWLVINLIVYLVCLVKKADLPGWWMTAWMVLLVPITFFCLEREGYEITSIQWVLSIPATVLLWVISWAISSDWLRLDRDT